MATQTADQQENAPDASEVPEMAISRVTGFGDAGLEAEWEKYCGYLDLTIAEFQEIQARLLQEQIALVAETPIGRKMFRGRVPKSVAEFREFVPLTTYGDYVGFFDKDRDEALGGESHIWAHTTGAQAGFKWVPYSVRGLERLLDSLMGAFILAAAKRKGEVNVRPGDTVLYNTPERPYVSGLVTFGMPLRFGFQTVLSPEVSEHMDFRERIRAGFRAALGKQVDVIISMTSVLTKVGQGFADQTRSTGFNRSILRPRAFWRVSRSLIKRKLLRMQVLPKDLWPTKAILGWGTDTSFFRDQVARYWGNMPFEIYACTEGALMAAETWERNGLVFNPYADFYEFIPIEESIRSREDERFHPRTLLVDEVEPGKAYEMVISNFYGMGFFRYRVGHLVQFLPKEEQSDTFALPQFTFEGRADDRIDMAGFTRLDAKTIWEAMGKTGYSYQDWTVRKEFEGDSPILHMFLELKGSAADDVDDAQATMAIHEAIRAVDPFYGDLETMLGIIPLKLTLLSSGTYDRFYDARKTAGYELELRTPPKMNTPEDDVADLIAASDAGK